jgi:hypothetical protein
VRDSSGKLIIHNCKAEKTLILSKKSPLNTEKADGWWENVIEF